MIEGPMENTSKAQGTLDVNAWLRGIAGFFVALSVALGYWIHPAWFLFTAFVGLNLLQSAFTGWCPMMWVLERAASRRSPVGGGKS